MNLISKSNPLEGTVIKTYRQEQGKGQIGRSWFSDVDKNITMSLILYPSFLPITRSFYLSMAFSLGVRDALLPILNKPVTIKWPNDIYVEDKKIAGILIQQNIQSKMIQSAVLGIGMNVNQKQFPDTLPNPISIYQVIKKEFELDKLESKIFKAFIPYYELLIKQEWTYVKRRYLECMYRRGALMTFYPKGGAKIEAELVGIDEIGRLCLSVQGKLQYYNVGEIGSSENFV